MKCFVQLHRALGEIRGRPYLLRLFVLLESIAFVIYLAACVTPVALVAYAAGMIR